jgi:hypothetical protein
MDSEMNCAPRGLGISSWSIVEMWSNRGGAPPECATRPLLGTAARRGAWRRERRRRAIYFGHHRMAGGSGISQRRRWRAAASGVLRGGASSEEGRWEWGRRVWEMAGRVLGPFIGAKAGKRRRPTRKMVDECEGHWRLWFPSYCKEIWIKELGTEFELKSKRISKSQTKVLNLFQNINFRFGSKIQI